MIRILFFGKLADASPALLCEIPEGIETTQQLSFWLGTNNAQLGDALSQKGNRIAVNQALINGDAPIKDGDEIAFMSPLSGG